MTTHYEAADSSTSTSTPSIELTRQASPFRRLATNVLDLVVVSTAILLYVSVASSGGEPEASLAALFNGLLLASAVQMLLWTRGRTIGKLLLKTQVFDERTGQPAGFLRMAVRETLGKFISGFFLGLGFFWLLLDSKQQAWHDKLVATLVRTHAS